MPFERSVLEELTKNVYYVRRQQPPSVPSDGLDKVIDFLCGDSKVLPAFHYDDSSLLAVVALVELFGDLGNPTANDQLLLQVFKAPVLSRLMSHFWSHWLLQYLRANQSQTTFSTIIILLKQLGIGDKEIMEQFISLLDGSRQMIDESLVEHPFFQNFFDSIPANFSPFQAGLWQWNPRNFSFGYFQLLDHYRPQEVGQYLRELLHESGRIPVGQLFAEFKNGKYLPQLLNLLDDSRDDLLSSKMKKLAIAADLFEYDPKKFLALNVKTATEYLHASMPEGRWGQIIQSSFFPQQKFTHLPFGAYALFILFTNDIKAGKNEVERELAAWRLLSIPKLQVILHFLGKDSFIYFKDNAELIETAKDYLIPFVNLLEENFNTEKILPILWGLAKVKAKDIQQQLAEKLVRLDPDAETKAIQLLNKKKAELRQTGAIILTLIGSDNSRNAILGLLGTESNDKARDLLLNVVQDSLPAEPSREYIENLIASAVARKKLDTVIVPWLDEKTVPPVFDQQGNAVPELWVRFLFYRLQRIPAVQSDPEADMVLQHIDKEKSAAFAEEILKRFINQGTKAEHKFVLALVALLGNDKIVAQLNSLIEKLIDENRTKMAQYCLSALALQGSNKALRILENLGRKYRNRKTAVGAAARGALEEAAEVLGITAHELGDRIVPDLGFDGLYREFAVGEENYRAFIDSKFKLAFFDEDNKKLKSIPAAAETELKNQFKAISKEIRDLVKAQTPRLEYYLITQRKWNFSDWDRFFRNNPVMFIYANRLLWGAYKNNGEMSFCFVCDEDSSLINIEGEEIDVPEELMIGIVHPAEIKEETVESWNRFFFDRSIDPIFQQLDRPKPDLSKYNLGSKVLTEFSGRQMKQGSTRSTLERYGWTRGPVVDGGMVSSFNLILPSSNVEAVLEVEGVGAGYGWGMEERLGDLFVVPRKKKASSYTYSYQSNTQYRIPLQDLPLIFLNEMIAAIEAIKPADPAESA